MFIFSVSQGDVGPVGRTGPQGIKGEQGDKGAKVNNEKHFTSCLHFAISAFCDFSDTLKIIEQIVLNNCI